MQLHEDITARPSISYEIDFAALDSYYERLLKSKLGSVGIMKQMNNLL